MSRKEVKPIQLPQAPDVEKSILSMLCIQPKKILKACKDAGIDGDCFGIPAYRELWHYLESEAKHATGDESLDSIKILHDLKDNGLLEKLGGHGGLVEAIGQSITTAQFATHAGILKKKREQRQDIVQSANRPPVICLGREGAEHVFYSTESRFLSRLEASKIKLPALLDIATRSHWERYLFPELVKAGTAPNKRELEETALERLLDDSRNKTFSPDAVRARGVWVDDAGGWIYNAGAACWHIPADGSRAVKVDNVRGKHVYLKGAELPAPDADMLTDEDGQKLVELMTARPWATPGAGDMVAGWLVASLLAGALPICPHVWIDSPSGRGKSSFYNQLLIMLGNAHIPSQDQQPTEPALRQSINGDSLAVLIDEAEPESLEKNNSLMKLIRTASYGNNVIIGGQNGTPKRYWVKCCMMLFSTANGIDRDTDASRFFVLAMQKVSNEKLKEYLKRQNSVELVMDSPDFHKRFISRLMRLLPVIMQSIKECTAELTQAGFPGRRAELMAVLMACRHALTSCTPMTREQCARAGAILRAYEKQADTESDFSQCLTHLLTFKVRVQNAGEMTVTDACELARGCEPDTREAAVRALSLVGMRWRDDKEALQVDTRATVMKKVYAGTRWASGKIMSVLSADCLDAGQVSPDGIWKGQARPGAGKTPTMCLFIPAELMKKD